MPFYEGKNILMRYYEENKYFNEEKKYFMHYYEENKYFNTFLRGKKIFLCVITMKINILMRKKNILSIITRKINILIRFYEGKKYFYALL